MILYPYSYANYVNRFSKEIAVVSISSKYASNNVEVHTHPSMLSEVAPWHAVNIFSYTAKQIDLPDELPEYASKIAAGTAEYEARIRAAWEDLKANPTVEKAKAFAELLALISGELWPIVFAEVIGVAVEDLTSEQQELLQESLDEHHNYIRTSLAPDIIRGVEQGVDLSSLDYRTTFLYAGALWSLGNVATIMFDGLSLRDLGDLFLFAGPNDESTCTGERGCAQYANNVYTVAQILADQIFPGRLRCLTNCRHIWLPIASPLTEKKEFGGNGVVKHLPGRHDQKKHAGGRGGIVVTEDVVQFESYDEFVNSAIEFGKDTMYLGGIYNLRDHKFHLGDVDEHEKIVQSIIPSDVDARAAYLDSSVRFIVSVHGDEIRSLSFRTQSAASIDPVQGLDNIYRTMDRMHGIGFPEDFRVLVNDYYGPTKKSWETTIKHLPGRHDQQRHAPKRSAVGDYGPRNPEDIKTLEDLKAYSEMPPAEDDDYEYFTHAVRNASSLEAIAEEGLNPATASGKLWASEPPLVRDLGAGYVVFRAPKGEAVHGLDVVERGLVYDEYTFTRTIPSSDIIKVVPEIPLTSTQHTLRADRFADYAHKNQGNPKGERVDDLPAMYRKWFDLPSVAEKHLPGRHDQQRHDPTKGVSAIPGNLPDNEYVRRAFEKSANYMEPGDVSSVKLIPDDEYKAIPNTDTSAAHYNAETKEIVLNELKMAVYGSFAEDAVAHEIGHAVTDRLVAEYGEGEFVDYWDLRSHNLSGSMRYDASEGLADLFATRVTDPDRFVRLHGQVSLDEFDALYLQEKAFKHLPGRHDQQRHDPHKGAGVGFVHTDASRKAEESYVKYMMGAGLGYDARREHFTQLGHDIEDVNRMDKILDKYGYGDKAQANAEKEIIAHLEADDAVGKVLRDQILMEDHMNQVFVDKVLPNIVERAHNRFERDWDWEQEHAGGMWVADAWYSVNDLMPGETAADLKVKAWDDKKLAVLDNEGHVYRKGAVGVSGDYIESWTRNYEGAVMGRPGEGGIGWDVSMRRDEIADKGYHVLGGQTKLMGAPGEAEITLIRLPKTVKLKHLPGRHDQQRHDPHRGGMRRVWRGQAHPKASKVTKLQTGEIGEQVAIHALQDAIGAEFRTVNVGINNAPIDVIGDHTAVEVKTGLASNSYAAQKWRLTIGQPGKAEAKALKSMTDEEKTAHNRRKMEAIMQRKQDLVTEFSQEIGVPVKPLTVGVILNPEGTKADVFAIDGFHETLRWNAYATDEYYLGTYDVDTVLSVEKHQPGRHDQKKHAGKRARASSNGNGKFKRWDSVSDADEWASGHYSEWAEGTWGTAEYDAVETYWDAYDVINGQLRGKEVDYGLVKKDQVDDAITNLDKALARKPAPDSFVAYRQMGTKSIGDVKEGMEFTDNGYASTSLNKDWSTGNFEGHLFEVHIPKGAKGAYLQDVKYAPPENEFLLARGTSFRVTYKGSGTPDDPSVVEVVGQD